MKSTKVRETFVINRRLLLYLFILFGVPLVAYTQSQIKLNIQDMFSATNFMGDGEYGSKYIKIDQAYKNNPHSSPKCIKIDYSFGPKRWGGLYWANKTDNWGEFPGSDFSKKAFTKIVFWARGETGTEVVEFKTGGINNPQKRYHDSLDVTMGRITLEKNWIEYSMNVDQEDLSSVVGVFCWVANADTNEQKRIVFYLDDISYQ
jgi:hypothetical protein